MIGDILNILKGDNEGTPAAQIKNKKKAVSKPKGDKPENPRYYGGRTFERTDYADGTFEENLFIKNPERSAQPTELDHEIIEQNGFKQYKYFEIKNLWAAGYSNKDMTDHFSTLSNVHPRYKRGYSLRTIEEYTRFINRAYCSPSGG